MAQKYSFRHMGGVPPSYEVFEINTGKALVKYSYKTEMARALAYTNAKNAADELNKGGSLEAQAT